MTPNTHRPKQCNRCGDELPTDQFTTDPRFGETCVDCHNELREQWGQPLREPTDDHPRVRGDGQPVGSLPPEMI